MSQVELSVLVPFFNEEDNVRALYDELNDVLRPLGIDHEMIFVNDGSADRTGTILDEIAAQDRRVVVLHLARNFGQTAAMSAAIDAARGALIVGMDGDRQNDPADIPAMLDRLNHGYDVVSGWRKDRKDRALTRRLPSRIANRMISLVSGVHLHDYGCSLKAYRREFISEVRLYGEMHRFIPIYTSWAGGRITEMEVNHRPRVAGKSKYGLRRVWKVLLDLLVVKFLDRYMVKPIHFFGGIGAIMLGFSLLSGLWAVGLKIFAGISFISTPLPLLTVMLFLVGVMMIMQGLMAEVLMRTYFEGQQKPVYRVRLARDQRD